FYRPSDCQTANQFEPFNINVQLPNNINNFSIQFVKVQLTNFDFYEYKIFNDDTNLPLTCLGCSPKASYLFWPGYSRPHKVRFQLTANDTLASKFTSTAIDIEEPENLKTPILIIPGIMGTEIVKETEFLWPDVSRMFFSS